MRGWIKVLSALIWLPFVLLYLVSLPFLFVYGLFLCVLAWYTLARESPKILVIQNGTEDAAGFLSRLQLQNLFKGRELLLDYSDHKNWPRWALPVRLFWQFGPIPMPPQFTPHFLPAILVLKKFRRPQTFSFGAASKDREAKFEQLLAELNEN